MPEERVKHCEEGIKNGGILMGLKTHNLEDAGHIKDRWKRPRLAGLPLVFPDEARPGEQCGTCFKAA